jgi:mRNA interferase RelE/StbE
VVKKKSAGRDTEPKPRLEYTIELTTNAARLFRNLPLNVQQQLRDSLRDLAKDPIQKGEKLKGKFSRFYRARTGNYRVIYDVQGSKLVVLVVIIADRKEAYQLLEQAKLA